MRRYDTEKTTIRTECTSTSEGDILMEVSFFNSIGGEYLDRKKLTIPKDMAKSKFTDVGITRHIMNFFVKG